MLSKNVIKYLEGPSKKYLLLIALVFGLIILSSLYGVVNNYYLALHYASLEGHNFTETLSLWNEETVLESFYSGYNHESKHRLNMAILSLGVAIIVSIQLIQFYYSRKINKRILAELIICGSISKEKENV